jgi:hypothetical protein
VTSSVGSQEGPTPWRGPEWPTRSISRRANGEVLRFAMGADDPQNGSAREDLTISLSFILTDRAARSDDPKILRLTDRGLLGELPTLTN